MSNDNDDEVPGSLFPRITSISRPSFSGRVSSDLELQELPRFRSSAHRLSLDEDNHHVHNENNDRFTNASGVDAESVVIVDDAASSICVDQYGTEREADLKHVAIDVLRQGASNQHQPTEFEQYTQRIARDVVLRGRADRKRKKRKRIGTGYSNYFYESSIEQPEHNTAHYTPSYEFDHFDGKRQNVAYNHQLNVLNEHGPERESTTGSRTTGNRMRTAPSIVTVDVDDLESHMYESDSSDADYDNESEEDVGSDAEFLESEIGTARQSSRKGLHPLRRRLKRKLQSRHMQLLALAGTLGSGLFYNSSSTLFASGPLGTLVGYIVGGFMAWCTMVSLGEMVSLLPSDQGITSFGSRFVEESLGFTLGVMYWFSTAIAVPTELVAAAVLISEFSLMQKSGDVDQAVLVWITFFLVLVVLANLAHVGAFGELAFLASFGTFICIIMLFIFLIVVNVGGLRTSTENVGFKYWNTAQSDPNSHQFYGPFRPFYTLEAVPISESALLATHVIAGRVGRFVQFVSAVNQAAAGYIGTEAVFTAAGEVRNPAKAIPWATRRIFWRIVVIYCVGILILSISVYAGDPRLVQPKAVNSNFLLVPPPLNSTEADLILNSSSIMLTASVNDSKVCSAMQTWYSSPRGAPSAWIIALQYAQQCGVSSAANALFIICLISSATMHLYASSRTLYGLGLQGTIWRGFAACSIVGVPYVAVLTSSLFTLLAYISHSSDSALAFRWLSSLATSTGLTVWAGFCLSFIRFFYGLERRNKSSIRRISRDDDTYPYKSPFQPYTAYFGLILNVMVVFFFGFNLFLHGQWNTSEFFAAYVALIIFVICYGTHKYFTRSRIVKLATMDLDSGRKEIAKMGWKEDRVYRYGLVEWLTKLGLRG